MLNDLAVPITICVIAGVVFLIAVVIITWWKAMITWFGKSVVKVDEALSEIDIASTKRYDLLTKLIESTKEYAKHESQTLMDVIKLRGNNLDGLTLEDKDKFNNDLSNINKEVSILVERYPDLKADTQFAILAKEASEAEERVQSARRLYNSNVSIFNQKRVSFPSSIVANAIGLKKDLEFFKADESKRRYKI